LLDTHTFLWWDGQKNNLTPQILTLCQDETNDLFLSIVSVWEIQIKVQLKKLTLRIPLPEIILHQQHTNQLQILPITLEHIFAKPAVPLPAKVVTAPAGVILRIRLLLASAT